MSSFSVQQYQNMHYFYFRSSSASADRLHDACCISFFLKGRSNGNFVLDIRPVLFANLEWWFGVVVAALVTSTYNCSTLGLHWRRLALAWMTATGVQIPVMEVYLGLTSTPAQLSLATFPWVHANEYWWWPFGHHQGIKWWLLRYSRPCNQDCW